MHGRYIPAPFVEGVTPCNCSCHPAWSKETPKPLATRHVELFSEAGQIAVYRCEECYQLWERARTQGFADFTEEGV